MYNMKMLPLLMPNLSVPLHWAWLGHHIVINRPVTIRILCTKLFAIDTLLQVFTVNKIPWSVHYDGNTLPSALSWDIVLILSHDHLDAEHAIEVAAERVNAYRARYLVTHLNHVDDNYIHTLGSIAWSRKLTRALIIRLEDHAIFAPIPKCHRPQIRKVRSVKWPDFRNVDLTNCTLQVAVLNYTPFHEFQSSDEETLKGILVPFFKYLQLALNFRAFLVPLDFQNGYAKLISGQVDMTFSGISLMPDLPLEVSCLTASELSWCVPNTCVVRSTTAMLWEEFSTVAWIMIVTSVMVVSIAVKWMAPPPSLTLGDAVLRIVGSIAGIGVTLPQGLARWPLAGWLLATVVLGCCYQTVLHSMMSAPLAVHEVEDLDGLSKSKMDLACVGPLCPVLLELENNTEVQADLSRRVIQIPNASEGLATFLSTHKKVSFFTSTLYCEVYYPEKRPLTDYRIQKVMYGVFGVTPWSWLAPAIRRITSQAESSGLAKLWFPTDKSTVISCAGVGSEDIKPIKIELLWPAILLLSIGFLLAAVAFFIEVLWFRFMTTNPRPLPINYGEMLYSGRYRQASK